MTLSPPSIYNPHSMDPAYIAELLQPFLAQSLSPAQLSSISTYIDILIRWNARLNLTSVREPEHIVTRHFGESLFAARHLFPGHEPVADYVDLGSGAGFPGLPIKIWAPEVRATLIESNHKKATFLREVVRALSLKEVTVFAARGEDFPVASADVVTIRAVERFDQALELSRRLARPQGKLALLIGSAQKTRAEDLTPLITWLNPIPVPLSQSRILLIGSRSVEPKQ